MNLKRIAVIGAGGCAREVAWLIKEINSTRPTFEFIGFLVSDVSKLGERDSRNQVLGDFSWIETHPDQIEALALGIGSPAARLKVGTELEHRFPHLEWPILVHPTARFDQESCRIEKGVLLFAGVLGTVNLEVGAFTMVSNASTLGHESSIGKGCLLNPSVNISGGVMLENGVLIGVGAQVLQYLRVGEAATVGAGAVVTKSVPSGVTVVGIPAQPLHKTALV